jgi:hypothetical protein
MARPAGLEPTAFSSGGISGPALWRRAWELEPKTRSCRAMPAARAQRFGSAASEVSVGCNRVRLSRRRRGRGDGRQAGVGSVPRSPYVLTERSVDTDTLCGPLAADERPGGAEALEPKPRNHGDGTRHPSARALIALPPRSLRPNARRRRTAPRTRGAGADGPVRLAARQPPLPTRSASR